MRILPSQTFHHNYEQRRRKMGERMQILKTDKGIILEVQMKPKSRSFRIQANDYVVIFCRQPPVEWKVNRELIKELSKIFERRVEIVSGFHSKIKMIVIKNAAKKEVLKVLESMRKDSDV